jgi:putative spermidine/putrescine transport system substrate-binding protein
MSMPAPPAERKDIEMNAEPLAPVARAGRRTLLKGLGAATAVVIGGVPAARAAPAQMVMATGGGKLEEAYRQVIFAPWKEKTGTSIVTTGNDGGKLRAMVEQRRVEWDVMQGPAEGLVVFGRQGLLEPIDYSGIDRSRLAPGTAHDTFVLTDFAAYCIGWNTKNVPRNPPKDWAGLWAHVGRIGLWKRPFQSLEVALLADGVAPRNLYPLNLDRAFASLDKVKKKLVWWNTGAQGAQLLLDGEVDAGAIWNGRVHDPRAAGAPVDFHFNQALLVSDAWGVPRGAPNKAEAMKLLAFALSPPVQAAFAKVIPYGPVNRDAIALIDEKTRAALPAPGPNNTMLSVEYWSEHGPAVVERFNKYVLA